MNNWEEVGLDIPRHCAKDDFKCQYLIKSFIKRKIRNNQCIYYRKYWSKELDIVAILPQSSGRPRQEWECGTPACVRDAQLRPKNLPIGQDVVLLRKPP